MTNLLLWLDLETTGLDPDHDDILEIACVVTGEDLATLRSFQGVIKPAWPLVMDTFVAAMHAKNGLLTEVHATTNTLQAVEQYVITELAAAGFVAGHAALTIAGATIHFDKSFLRRQMPNLHALLHYRTFDVSTLKAAASMWIGKMPKSDNDAHRAMVDVEEALQLARQFRQAFASVGTAFKLSLGLPTEAA